MGGLLLCSGRGADAADAEKVTLPDRRELWVPMDKLGSVLTDDKAVILSREQYSALLRDAGIEKPEPLLPPREALLTTSNYTARLEKGTAVITGELRLTVLTDAWAQVPLEFHGAMLGDLKLDADSALAVPGGEVRTIPTAPNQPAAPASKKPVATAVTPERPAVLLLRGKGEHTVTFTLTTPVQTAAGQSTVALVLPPTASGAFALALPAGTKVESAALPVKVTAVAGAAQATVALTPAVNTVALVWRAAEAAPTAPSPVAAVTRFLYALDTEKLDATFDFRFRAALGDLPQTFSFILPPATKVLGVEAAELAGWESEGGHITVRLQPGARRELDLRLSAEWPALVKRDSAHLQLPVPEVTGVQRMAGEWSVTADNSVVVREVNTDAASARRPTAEDRGGQEFAATYRFSTRPAAQEVVIERAQPKLEADLDTLVEFRAEAVYLERTVTLRDEHGRRFASTITLPEGEELLSVRRVIPTTPLPQGSAPALTPREYEPEWRATKDAITITWTDESSAPRIFKIRSRSEPAQWAQLPAAGVFFPLRDARISDAAKVSGYIALVAEAAFRLEAAPGETLERRDGRATPVRGDYAWFRRDAFELGLRIYKRPAEVLAALTGYALPLEGVLDLHATMNYQFLHGGTRAVRLRVPKELAANFHFEGPQIAERTLTDDVWTITFQKELTGAYALSIAAQVPVPKLAEAGRDTAQGYTFAVKVPVIAPLEVARASGLWAVEANTETEISFEATGLNELDTLLAPRLADYQSTHRIIGVFGWIGADYALGLRGVRHAPAAVLATVVDRLDLETVVSPTGVDRHQARMTLRTAGAQYLDVGLPAGSSLLSLAVDAAPIKPVAAPPAAGSADGASNRVRVQLPAKQEANAPITVTLLYETPGVPWSGSGAIALAAPRLAPDVPILRSQWRVWLPEGYTYSGYESNLLAPVKPPDEVLASKLARFAAEKLTGSFGSPTEAAGKPASRDEPKPIDAAISAPSANPAVASPKSKPATADKSELLLVREFKVPPSVFQVPSSGKPEANGPTSSTSAKDFLAAQGVAFGPHSFAMYSPASGTLIAKGTKEQLDRIEQLTMQPSGGRQSKGLAANSVEHSTDEYTFGGRKTAGLLPVLLELPRNGRALVFDGLYAPQSVKVHYDDWWSRARRLWLWFVAGGLGSYLLGRARPWWRSLWAALVLSAIPLCLLPLWTAACNALLGGWLVGLVLERLSALVVFRARREVLA